MPKKMIDSRNNMKMASFRLDDDCLTALEMLANDRGLNKSEMIRELIRSPRPVYSDFERCVYVLEFCIDHDLFPENARNTAKYFLKEVKLLMSGY